MVLKRIKIQLKMFLIRAGNSVCNLTKKQSRRLSDWTCWTSLLFHGGIYQMEQIYSPSGFKSGSSGCKRVLSGFNFVPSGLKFGSS